MQHVDEELFRFPLADVVALHDLRDAARTLEVGELLEDVTGQALIEEEHAVFRVAGCALAGGEHGVEVGRRGGGFGLFKELACPGLLRPVGEFREAQSIIEQFAEHAFRVVIMQVERCARDFRLAAERRNRDFFIRRMREEFQQCVLDHLLRHQRSAVGFSLHCLLRFYTDFRNLSRNVSFP